MYVTKTEETFYIVDKNKNAWHKCIGIKKLMKEMVDRIGHTLDAIYQEIDFSGYDKTIGSRRVDCSYYREVNVDDQGLRVPKCNDTVLSESDSDLCIGMPLYYNWRDCTVTAITGETLTLHFRQYCTEYDTVPTVPKRYLILRDLNNGFCRTVNIRGYEKDLKAEIKAYRDRLNAIFAEDRSNPRGRSANACGDCDPGERLNVPYHSGESYLFRRSAVPGTGVKYGRYYRFTPARNCKYQLVHANDLRPGLRVDMYDLNAGDRRIKRVKNYDRSWKSSYKCRHQYEKHLMNKTDRGNYSAYSDTEYDMYQILEEDFEKQLFSNHN